MNDETKAWRITGRVQGVGFRYFVLLAATNLPLTGWTRNCPDGSVEVAARGQLSALESLRKFLLRGPRMSRVESVEEVPPPQSLENTRGFNIK